MDEIEIIASKTLIFLGILMYIFGLIGNLLNIFVFTIWCQSKKQQQQQHNNNNNNRTSNSPLYLLISSCFNFIEIIYPMLTRIIFDGFRHEKTKENEFYTCKFRYFILHTSDLISLICICLAIFDRYLISSRNVRLRRLSRTYNQTKIVILILICLILIHNIPIYIYYERSNTNDCIIISRFYLYYYLFVIQISFHGIFPILFLSIFGYLTYKQLKQINNQRNLNSEKQLSRMLLLLCICILISSIPYCINNIYSIILRDLNTELKSYTILFYYISAILFFTNATFSFYIFFISTPNFRKELKKIFQCKFIIRRPGNNQVHTITTT